MGNSLNITNTITFFLDIRKNHMISYNLLKETRNAINSKTDPDRHVVQRMGT